MNTARLPYDHPDRRFHRLPPRAGPGIFASIHPATSVRFRTAALLAAALLYEGCARGQNRTNPDSAAAVPDTALVYIAASLTKPLQPALDAWGSAHHVRVLLESGGSLEHARKITELHRVPDLLVLADADVFPELLFPRYVDSYAAFARNRMVVAYRPTSRHASEIDSTNWTRVVTRPDVEVGRTDPSAAPVGYRTLLLFQLAERHYREPGLAARLLARAPDRNVRPNAAALAALLQLGELDYIYDYESVARTFGLTWIPLPDDIDLGDPTKAGEYARASVRVRGSGGDTVTIRGAPILYAIGLTKEAPHPRAARALDDWLLSADGRAAMRRAGIDALDSARVVRADASTAAGAR